MIKHFKENAFIVAPSPDALTQPHQDEAIRSFTDTLEAAAKNYSDRNNSEKAILVIDMKDIPSINSSALADLSESARRLKGNGHEVILAKTPRKLALLMSKMDPQKQALKFEMAAAEVTANEAVLRYAQEQADEKAHAQERAEAASKKIAEEAAPVAPPPSPKRDNWTHETMGNATVVNAPEHFKATEEYQAEQVRINLLAGMPGPDPTASGTKKTVIFDMKDVGFFSDSAIGKLLYIHRDMQKKGISLVIANASSTTIESIRTKKMDRLLNISGKPVEELVEAANAKPGVGPTTT